MRRRRDFKCFSFLYKADLAKKNMLFPTIANRKNIATQLFYLENFTIKLRKKRLKFMSVCFKKSIDVHRCWIYLSKKIHISIFPTRCINAIKTNFRIFWRNFKSK